jgi:hypothetical protein
MSTPKQNENYPDHMEDVQNSMFHSMGYVLEAIHHPKYWQGEDADELFSLLLQLNRESGKFLKKVID